MDDAALDDLRVFLPPLLRAMEGLGFVARRLDPPQLARVLAIVAEPQAALQAVRARVDGWPEDLAPVRERLTSVADEALSAYEELGAADDMRGVYRALRHVPRAQEALYPLADGLPPVEPLLPQPGPARRRRAAGAPGRRAGARRRRRLPRRRRGGRRAAASRSTCRRPTSRIARTRSSSRCTAAAGNGRGFLWSWLRDARSRRRHPGRADRGRRHLGAAGPGRRQSQPGADPRRGQPIAGTSIRPAAC